MIRSVIVLILFLAAAFFAGLYWAYGTVHPCRALAVEQARRAIAPAPLAALFIPEGHDQGACAKSLIRSWQNRLAR